MAGWRMNHLPVSGEAFGHDHLLIAAAIIQSSGVETWEAALAATECDGCQHMIGEFKEQAKKWPLPSFTAPEGAFFTITGRGQAVAIDAGQHDGWDYDPHDLNGQTVLVNGKPYRVTGVGTFSIHRSAEQPYVHGFDLLIKEPPDGADDQAQAHDGGAQDVDGSGA